MLPKEMEDVSVGASNPESQIVMLASPESSGLEIDALKAIESTVKRNNLSHTLKARILRRKRTNVNDTNCEHHCEICYKNFPFQRSLNLHMQRCHIEIHLEKKSFICKFCGRNFKHSEGLKIHELSHQGLKPYTCKICGAGYTQKRGLTNHMAVHNGDKQFECDFCGRAFWHVDGVRKHVNRFHGNTNNERGEKKRNRPYPCKICGKIVGDDLSLTRHMYIHTGEKEANCSICKRDFTRLSSLKRHIRRRHNPCMTPKKRGIKKKMKNISQENECTTIDTENKSEKYYDGARLISDISHKKGKIYFPSERKSVYDKTSELENTVKVELDRKHSADQDLSSDLLARIKDERVLSEDTATISYCEYSNGDGQYSPRLGTTVKKEAETETETGKVIGDTILTGSERVSLAVTVGPGCSPFVHTRNKPTDTDSEDDLEPMESST